MAGSSSLSERAFLFLFWFDYSTLLNEALLTWRIFVVVVLLPFSNRCLSCSDKTHSTTWLHPRTGEPVNSGHMIRSGTREILICGKPRGRFFFIYFFFFLLQCVFCLWPVVQRGFCSCYRFA